MADRSTLAIGKLEDFKAFLVSEGWMIEQTKGLYEVLRARRPGRNTPLLVFQRDFAKEHLSVYDTDMPIVRHYLWARKNAKHLSKEDEQS